MRKITVTGLLFMVAVVSVSTLAEAGQALAPLWSTSVKITCDRTIPRALVSVRLCRFNDCGLIVPALNLDPVDLECGASLETRSAGLRVESDFEPTNFIFTFQVFDENGNETCFKEAPTTLNPDIPVMGSTVTCNGDRSPKLSVGRPH